MPQGLYHRLLQISPKLNYLNNVVQIFALRTQQQKVIQFLSLLRPRNENDLKMRGYRQQQLVVLSEVNLLRIIMVDFIRVEAGC